MKRTWSVLLGAIATAVVALGAAVLSWDAQSWGAGQLGVDGRLTWLYPVVIDGTILVGTVAALALRRAHYRIRAYVWALLAGAIAVSVVGNAAHAAAGSLVHVLGAAVPAVALAAALHLLVILVRHAPGGPPNERAELGELRRALEAERATVARLRSALPNLPAGAGADPIVKRARQHPKARSQASRAAVGERHEQVRALLAAEGRLTGTEIGARLGIDPGYARRVRDGVEEAEHAPALAVVGNDGGAATEAAPTSASGEEA